MTDVRVVLVDDQPLIRNGLRDLLEDAGIAVVGEAGDGRESLSVIARTAPDVVLMDLRMPVMDGVVAVRVLRDNSALASIPVLVLTTFDGDDDVLAAVQAGARGFISKTAVPDDIVAAVIAIAGGAAALSSDATRALMRKVTALAPPPLDPGLRARVDLLTARERDMVAAAARGLDNQQIAKELHISPFTVKTHLNRAMTKLDARDRGQLVALAYRSGVAHN
ncbi:response regulator [Microbacterium sp. Mcb102]|uniref:response regulator n=1 Tax=Microbacterium sp. Mcb102 TaxID=2926012 RepID=UPI0021C69245|nr:response regulator transcription factor [Microbacterium sp. Mcb102]